MNKEKEMRAEETRREGSEEKMSGSEGGEKRGKERGRVGTLS